MPPGAFTEAWLHRLANRVNSTASMTPRFGTHSQEPCTTVAISVTVLDGGNNSPHLAPLFPARRPQVGALARTRIRNGPTAVA